MRPSNLIPLFLSAALWFSASCGSDQKGVTSGDVSRDENPAEGSGGGGKDAGKDSGKPSASSGGEKDAGGGKQDTTELGPETCDRLNIKARPQAPRILIVQDRSGSMVGYGDPRNMGKNRWIPSANAIKKLTADLTETVAFGLMLFPSQTMGGIFAPQPPGGPGCGIGKLNVPVETGTADAIAMALDANPPDVGATPTAASLDAAKGALVEDGCVDCGTPPPMYILLLCPV